MVRIPTTPVGRNFESFLLDPLGLFLHHYLPLLLQGCPSSQTSTPSSSWPATLLLLLLLLERQVSLGIDREESTWLTGGPPPTPKCADTCSVRDEDKQSRRRTIGQTKSDTAGLCQRQAAFLLKARTKIELKENKKARSYKDECIKQ